ncbi:MAG TPA: ABC transporter ATP-binding protein [Gaiellaceae bacterium]|nr:ABC transporter ATP-binding protein [Gaiellaceae bacterium]
MVAAPIQVEGLGKRYRIGQLQSGYGTLRESLSHAARRLVRKEHKPPQEEIWALKDVTFSVEQGDVLGVIGRNGAGKSTLLKLLTRITTPTTGQAVIRGRVGSLLEVGTGFHPELTGRENIYLNGAILGMGRREITRKLPEIIDFAGVATFIDTPVKRYSSGMYVRLAFSVAAHLEPEILLVDEVLAVGDAEFQRRCLGRMEEFSRSGRTVVFVSHQMQTLARLCDRAILLDGGEIVRDGPSDEVVAHYLQTVTGTPSRRVFPDLDTAPGDKRARLREIRVVDEHGDLADSIDVRRPVGIEITFTVLRDDVPMFPKIKLYDREGDTAFNALDTSDVWDEPPAVGDHSATCWIPGNYLNEGLYTVDVGVVSLGRAGMQKLLHHTAMREAVSFHVYDPGEGDTSKGRFPGHLRGPVRPLLEWTTERR